MFLFRNYISRNISQSANTGITNSMFILRFIRIQLVTIIHITDAGILRFARLDVFGNKLLFIILKMVRYSRGASTIELSMVVFAYNTVPIQSKIFAFIYKSTMQH